MSALPEKKNDLPVVSRRSLRKGQAALFDLIVSKMDSKELITLAEAEEIWRTKVCRNFIGGVPYSERWVYEDGTYRSKLERMAPFEIEFNTVNWLMRTIGMLVMRGYLKAVPAIQLEEISDVRPTD